MIFQQRTMTFFLETGDLLEDIMPSFWSVAHSEMLAAELCALSIIEYDHLPLKFYLDLAKQSWDEAGIRICI